MARIGAKAPTRRSAKRSMPVVMRGLPAGGNPPPDSDDERDNRRKLMARFCQMVGEEMTGKPPVQGLQYDSTSRAALAQIEKLAPRIRQTLERLLTGDSEKEIAARLGVSRHTIHVYVKSIYRHFNVSSRGELFARFVDRPR